MESDGFRLKNTAEQTVRRDFRAGGQDKYAKREAKDKAFLKRNSREGAAADGI